MGVYCFTDGDASYVGYSRNIRATQKRLEFELKLNACSYARLQRFYNESDLLRFELLEEYTPPASITELEADAHLQALLLKHKTRLKATCIQTEV
jgi:hypothetical protein